MIKRNSVLLVFLLVVTGLIVVLFGVDFRIARSNTNIQSSLATSRSGTQVGNALQGTELALYVEGPERMARTLGEELASQLRSGPAFIQVRLLETPPEKVDQPVLVVEIIDPNIRWMPVYARAALVARVAYASDGDVSWRHEENPVMQLSGTMVRSNGDFDVTDVTAGLVSRPGYDSHLGKQVANRVGESMKEVWK